MNETSRSVTATLKVSQPDHLLSLWFYNVPTAVSNAELDLKNE